MIILHDHPVLSPAEIRDATLIDLADSDLHLQAERPRITPLSLASDELFKLWSGFSTSYRVSAAYEVSLVLIDSTLGSRAPLPVLRRGPMTGERTQSDTGAQLRASCRRPTPWWRGSAATVRLIGRTSGPPCPPCGTQPQVARPHRASARCGPGTQLTVALPDTTAARNAWTPGVYDVAVVSAPPGLPTVVGEPVSMALGATVDVSPQAAPAGDLTLTIECTPRQRPARGCLAAGPTVDAKPARCRHPRRSDAADDGHDHVQRCRGRHLLVRLRWTTPTATPSGSPESPALEFTPAAQVVVT